MFSSIITHSAGLELDQNQREELLEYFVESIYYITLIPSNLCRLKEVYCNSDCPLVGPSLQITLDLLGYSDFDDFIDNNAYVKGCLVPYVFCPEVLKADQFEIWYFNRDGFNRFKQIQQNMGLPVTLEPSSLVIVSWEEAVFLKDQHKKAYVNGRKLFINAFQRAKRLELQFIDFMIQVIRTATERAKVFEKELPEDAQAGDPIIKKMFDALCKDLFENQKFRSIYRLFSADLSFDGNVVKLTDNPVKLLDSINFAQGKRASVISKMRTQHYFNKENRSKKRQAKNGGVPINARNEEPVKYGRRKKRGSRYSPRRDEEKLKIDKIEEVTSSNQRVAEEPCEIDGGIPEDASEVASPPIPRRRHESVSDESDVDHRNHQLGGDSEYESDADEELHIDDKRFPFRICEQKKDKAVSEIVKSEPVVSAPVATVSGLSRAPTTSSGEVSKYDRSFGRSSEGNDLHFKQSRHFPRNTYFDMREGLDPEFTLVYEEQPEKKMLTVTVDEVEQVRDEETAVEATPSVPAYRKTRLFKKYEQLSDAEHTQVMVKNLYQMLVRDTGLPVSEGESVDGEEEEEDCEMDSVCPVQAEEGPAVLNIGQPRQDAEGGGVQEEDCEMESSSEVQAEEAEAVAIVDQPRMDAVVEEDGQMDAIPEAESAVLGESRFREDATDVPENMVQGDISVLDDQMSEDDIDSHGVEVAEGHVFYDYNIVDCDDEFSEDEDEDQSDLDASDYDYCENEIDQDSGMRHCIDNFELRGNGRSSKQEPRVMTEEEVDEIMKLYDTVEKVVELEPIVIPDPLPLSLDSLQICTKSDQEKREFEKRFPNAKRIAGFRRR